VAVIGGFRSDLSITGETDGNSGNEDWRDRKEKLRKTGNRVKEACDHE